MNGDDSLGLSLRSVEYAEVTGEDKDDAIMVMLCQTGGTQNTD